MKMRLKELASAHELRCPHCNSGKLRCIGVRLEHVHLVPLLECGGCTFELRLILEQSADAVRMYLRDTDAEEERQADAMARSRALMDARGR